MVLTPGEEEEEGVEVGWMSQAKNIPQSDL